MSGSKTRTFKHLSSDTGSFPSTIRDQHTEGATNSEASELFGNIVKFAMNQVFKAWKTRSTYVYTGPGHGVVAWSGDGLDIGVADKAPSVTQFQKEWFSVRLCDNGINNTLALAKHFTFITRVTDKAVEKSTVHMKHLWTTRTRAKAVYYCMEAEEGVMTGEKFITEAQVFEKIPELEKNRFTSNQIGVVFDVKFDNEVLGYSQIYIPKSTRYAKYVGGVVHGKECRVFLNGVEVEQVSPYPIKFDYTVKSKDPNALNKECRFFGSFEFVRNFKKSKILNSSVNCESYNAGKHISIVTDAFRTAYCRAFPDFNYGGNEIRGIHMEVNAVCEHPTKSPKIRTKLLDIEGIEVDDGFVEVFSKLIDSYRAEFLDHNRKLEKYTVLTYAKPPKKSVQETEFLSNKHSTMEVDGFFPCPDMSSTDKELIISPVDGFSTVMLNVLDNREASYYQPGIKPSQSLVEGDHDDGMSTEVVRNLINVLTNGVGSPDDESNIQYSRVIILANFRRKKAASCCRIISTCAKFIPVLFRSHRIFVCECPTYIQDGRMIFRDEENTLDRTKPFERIGDFARLGVEDLHKLIVDKNTRRLIRLTEEKLSLVERIDTNILSRRTLLEERNLVSNEFITANDLGL